MPDYPARRTMMVDTQIRPSDVTKFPIIEAFLHIPREVFVPTHLKEAAYAGENLMLGEGRILLEPRTMAKMLDALNITRTELVLDVGAGLGYSTAVIAQLAEAVVGVEENDSFAADAQTNLGTQAIDNAVIHQGPLVEGDAQHGPYDVIIVQGGVEVLPDALVAQLKEGGRVACLFMSGALGVGRLGVRQHGTIAWRDIFNAAAPVVPGFAKAPEFTL